MDHDPFVSSASAQDLIHMVDSDPDASQRERRLCEFIARTIRDSAESVSSAEERADDAENRAEEAGRFISKTMDDLQKILDRLEKFT